MHMQGQDWNDVIIRKKPATSSQASKPSAVNAAIRAGACRFGASAAALLHVHSTRLLLHLSSPPALDTAADKAACACWLRATAQHTQR